MPTPNMHSQARNYTRMICPADGRKVDIHHTMVAERKQDGWKVDPFPDERPDVSDALPDRHKGRSALVLATGPSLSAVPLHILMDLINREQMVVWGVNDVWRSHKTGAPKCDYYLTLDDRYFTTYTKEILAYLQKHPRCLPCFGFAAQFDVRYYEVRINMHATAPVKPDPADPARTVFDPNGSVPEYQVSHYFNGYSSGIAAVQMAMHAGCSRIYLLGHDCTTDSGRTHTFGVRSGEESANKYPQGRNMLPGYEVLAMHAKQRGQEIINLSARSAIQSFPRLDPVQLAMGNRVALPSQPTV